MANNCENIKTKLIKFSTIFTIASAVASITFYLTHNTYLSKINELESVISSLDLNERDNSIDLSNYFIYKGANTKVNLPLNSVFDNDKQFYFSPSNYWKHFSFSDIDFCKYLNEEISNPITNIQDSVISDYWISDYYLDLNGKGYQTVLNSNESLLLLDSFPNGILYTYSKKPKKLLQYIKLTRNNNKKSFNKTRDYFADSTVESVSFADMGFKHLVSYNIMRIIDELVNSLPFNLSFTEIQSITMRDNWMYMTTFSEFQNEYYFTNKSEPFYCFRDWYLFYSNGYFYELEIQTPAMEPTRRGKQFLELNKWLSYFRIVYK